MRLINTQTLTITEFFGSFIPPYAILSHTWEFEEVSLQEFQSLSGDSPKNGFAKIQRACNQAIKDGLNWCWVDTCCIDKTSSAELSEAINSMYAWYRDAAVCYAYLADVATAPIGTRDMEWERIFRSSKWFTRGWTLQELLAPERMLFFSATWTPIGSKKSLESPIGEATGIELDYLNDWRYRDEASVAKKMSWMANRVTTRLEDSAYCLLGIFEVNMPLLYGEGDRAFVRLQEEILKHSDDQSIFCWVWESGVVDADWSNVLAPCPAAFTNSGHFRPAVMTSESPVRPYNITNAGLSISLPFVSTSVPDLVLGILQVQSDNSTHTGSSICIPLKKTRIHCRIRYPAVPLPLELKMAGPYKQTYILCRSANLTRGPSSPSNERDFEIPLSNMNEFGFLLCMKHVNREISAPELCYSTPNMQYLKSRSLLKFSFPDDNINKTIAVAIFRISYLFPGTHNIEMQHILVLAAKPKKRIGRRGFLAYCRVSSDSDGSPGALETIANNIKLKSVQNTLQSRSSSMNVKIGEEVALSSANYMKKNARVVYIDSEGEVLIEGLT